MDLLAIGGFMDIMQVLGLLIVLMVIASIAYDYVVERPKKEPFYDVKAEREIYQELIKESEKYE